MTASKALDAFGGRALWQGATYAEALVSADGLAFTLKRRKAFRQARIELDLRQAFCALSPIGEHEAYAGGLKGQSSYLIDQNGQILAERKQAKSYFPYGRRLFHWDDLDMSWFANYAFWNYFSLPKLLLSDQIQWTEKRPGILLADFSEDIPTHSRFQEFRFSEQTGRLLQHNYTAEVISSYARAANCVVDYANNGLIAYPSRRIVSPQGLGGRALGFPILINIHVHELKLTNKPGKLLSTLL